MATIFISYGNKVFKKSLSRIRKQAKQCSLFDKVILYSQEDLPAFITSSPLFAFEKGGGYWLWKPYIIYRTLEKSQIDDVIVYADAGCTLNPDSKQWEEIFNKIKNCNAIFFQYRSNVKYEGWERWSEIEGNISPEIIHWMKPSVISYFKDYFGNDDFLHYNKIMGGIIVIKKTTQILNVIEQWYKISLFHPELLIDPFGKELSMLPDSFNVHRHEQAIITPLVFYYQKDDCIIVLPETAESQKENAAIVATRKIVWTWKWYDKIAYHFKQILHTFSSF